MKEKKKRGTIIFGIVCIVIVAICVIIQVVLAGKSKELEQESKKYETLITQTKSGKEIETEYIHVGDKKFFIKIPKEFQQLDYEMINQKYNGDVPEIVFSNEEITINVAINNTENTMKDNQISSYKSYMEKVLGDSCEIISSKEETIDNHHVGKIELISKAEDSDIYNHMMFFSYEDKLVIVTFNCTIDLQDEWKEVGDFIIDSLFFTE